MLTKDKALEMAVHFHSAFAHLQGFQNPKNIIDTAEVFMQYCKCEDNSVKESTQQNITRNPSKSGNS